MPKRWHVHTLTASLPIAIPLADVKFSCMVPQNIQPVYSAVDKSPFRESARQSKACRTIRIRRRSNNTASVGIF